MASSAPTISDLALAMGGRLLQGDGTRTYRGASIDSRSLKPGGVFFALRGARTDGHKFVGAARTRGAAAAVVERRVPVPRSFPLIRADSASAALRAGAAWHRRRFCVPLVGVTGSNGKTMTKDLIAHLLARFGVVASTSGNLNNTLGVPLTLFKLGQAVRSAVVEMAMNRPGEIRTLARLAAPTAGVVLNAGLAHAWKFRSRRAIAGEKADLIRGLPRGGMAFLNADDEAVWDFRNSTGARVLGFGMKRGEVRAEKVSLDPAGRARFLLRTPSGCARAHTRLLGAHNALNAIAAAAVGWAFGLGTREIAAALGEFRPVAGMRMERRRFRSGGVAIVDCYNANPGSVRAALEFLKATHVRRPVLVLGEMRELGAHSPAEHAFAGRLAASLGPRLLVGVGPASRPLVAAAVKAGTRDALWVRDAMEAAGEVAAALGRGVVALFKGSRAVGLERLVESLEGGGYRAV